jgi:hypothetical protein
MMKETKPFNLEHAKAGAPFCTASGEKVEIVKWDMKSGNCPILGLRSDNEYVQQWAMDGEPAANFMSVTRLVMTPLGYIDGKPVFVGDEIELKCMAKPDEWKRVKAEPTWAGTWTDECARWPAPAKQYPVTGMAGDVLWGIYNSEGCIHPGMFAVANAALRHAIDNGQVITMKDHADKLAEVGRKVAAITSPDLSSFAQAPRWQEHIDGFGAISGVKDVVQGVKRAIEGRAVRDMAIAIAVERTTRIETARAIKSNTPVSINLDAIIASVKEQ